MKLDFATKNTPLTRTDGLAEALGLRAGQLWVKRDDLTGLTAGGNKARKLEYLVADAAAQHADVLVTTGAAQSNHVRATAAAARLAGMDCVAVLSTLGAPHEPEGNLILDDLFGVEAVWTSPGAREQVLAETAAALRESGRRPYVIPLGGTNALGTRGYVHAADEITAQLPDATIACAVGTGGTAAGLVVGLGDYDRLVGIDVAGVRGIDEKVPALVSQCAAAMERPEPAGQWHYDSRYRSIPYGQPFDAVFQAIRTTAITTGLALDPVYTGRAMAGLMARIEEGTLPQTPIVFVHTGGLPALFTQRYRERFSVPRVFDHR